MFTEPSPLSPALLTLWATNHATTRRVRGESNGLSGWVLDERMNASSLWRRKRHRLDLGGTKPWLLWCLWMDHWGR
jgi:hypothetical protein